MDFFDILLAKKLEDDRDPKVEGLSVTQNGRYHEDGIVYDPVIVEVPQPTMTKLTATENGTYTAPSGTAYNEVDVDVPLPSNAYLLKEVEDLPASIATFEDGSDMPLKSLTASIEAVQEGSGDPSPSNVRPISGWTGAKVNNMPNIGTFSKDGWVTKLTIPWKDGNNNYDMPFNYAHTEVVTDDNGNDITVADFESHYVLPFDCVYDEPEAIYASASNLAAGDYYFKIVNDSWGGNTGKYVSFTLSETLTAGKQIRKKSGATNAAIENCTLGIYDSGSDRTGTELAFTTSTTEPSSGTNLGQTDGTGECNHWHCVVYGYNRWKFSAVRQFLNSDATANNWWRQQHKWDVKPSYATTKDGFLHGLSEEVKSQLKITKIITARNTLFNSGDTPLGGMDETYDRVFLASLEQMYINPQISGEGDYWEYYKRLLGRTTPASTGATYARLIKYDLATQTTACNRWLRSAYRGYAHIVWYVNASGNVGYYYANNGLRLAPCLRIEASNLYTIPFTDSQGNPVEVYGGSVDVVNGVLTVTHKRVLLGDLDWSWFPSETTSGYYVSDYNQVIDDMKTWSSYYHALSWWSNIFTIGTVNSVPQNNGEITASINSTRLRVRYDDIQNDANAFKSWLASNNAELVYELATPTTFYTQPTAVKSIEGENVIFADTGDIQKVEYLSQEAPS